MRSLSTRSKALLRSLPLCPPSPVLEHRHGYPSLSHALLHVGSRDLAGLSELALVLFDFEERIQRLKLYPCLFAICARRPTSRTTLLIIYFSHLPGMSRRNFERIASRTCQTRFQAQALILRPNDTENGRYTRLRTGNVPFPQTLRTWSRASLP